MENERTPEKVITASISKRCALAVKGKVIFSIQDTLEINLDNHKNRINKDDSIGTTNSLKNGLGFIIHPSLVVSRCRQLFSFGILRCTHMEPVVRKRR